MSVLLLTNPYAPQQQAVVGMGQSIDLAGVLTAQAVTPAESSAGTRNGGSATGYDGMGAGAGGAAAQQPLKAGKPPERPADATPRSIITAQAEATADQTSTEAELRKITAQPPAEPPEIIDMAERTRQRAQEMPLPLPTMPFLEQR